EACGTARLVQDRALHLADELIDFERLPADVGGTQKARDLPAIGTTAHDDDRHPVRVRPPLTPARDELRSVEVREADVEDDGSGFARERGSESLAPVNGRDDVESD